MDCDRDNDLQESAELEGRYANSFKVGQNAFEFIIDFGQSRLFQACLLSTPFV